MVVALPLQVQEPHAVSVVPPLPSWPPLTNIFILEVMTTHGHFPGLLTHMNLLSV